MNCPVRWRPYGERYRLAGVEAPTIDEVINGFKDKKAGPADYYGTGQAGCSGQSRPWHLYGKTGMGKAVLSSKTIWIRILISHLQSTGIFWEPPENMQSCCWMHLTSAR